MNVTVYGRPGCQPCAATRRRLDNLGIAHQFLDVDKLSNDARCWLVDTIGTSPYALPFVVVRYDRGSDSWTGYRPDRIDALA